MPQIKRKIINGKEYVSSGTIYSKAKAKEIAKATKKNFKFKSVLTIKVAKGEYCIFHTG